MIVGLDSEAMGAKGFTRGRETAGFKRPRRPPTLKLLAEFVDAGLPRSIGRVSSPNAFPLRKQGAPRVNY